LRKSGPGPVWVHSDLLVAGRFIERIRDREALLQRHLGFLKGAADGRDLWLPCFNYDYPKTRQFDARTAVCQLGPLGEYFRTHEARWRTADPIFSVAGLGSQPEYHSASTEVDPFDRSSAFAELCDRDGTVLFYGAPFSSVTIIHYAERKGGGPVYRYDKMFPGSVTEMAGNTRSINYCYHVRPWGKHLGYDWDRIVQDATSAGILQSLDREQRCVARMARARDLIEYWVEQVRQDPLYLLDTASRQWVQPQFETLGRRFLISDFE
jgi:aminoglycoside 3-N-acetyltransferase